MNLAGLPPLGVHLDGPEGVVGETFLVDGWAAGCGVTIVEAYTGIDYYPIVPAFPHARQDIVDFYQAQSACAVPLESGFAALMQTSQYPPGWHMVALLVRDSAGRWAWSNARSIYVP